jgi:phage terminase large subunit-like protein
MERKLVHANVPIMNWSMANAVVILDTAGNRKLDKEKAAFRIDGAVSLAMAMGLRARSRGYDNADYAIDVRALIG